MTILDEAKKLRALIEQMAENLDDEEAEKNPNVFPKWEIGVEYKKDFKLRYNDVTYKVLQDHTSQEDWTPDTAVSLYVKVHKQEPTDEYPLWIQPSGAHDAYSKGDKCSLPYHERFYISNVDNNVWSPEVYGWDEVFPNGESEVENAETD